MDDIGVPTAPMLVPSATAAQFSVKWESRMADGTLLITWLLINAVGNTPSTCINHYRKDATAPIWATLPLMTKKQTNVRISE